MGNSEACRIVGISRSSGTRWRHGHTVVLKSGDIKKYARISLQRPTVISARFLSELERITIADLLHAGRGVCAIARELGRSPSTVSRETRRNTHVQPIPARVRKGTLGAMLEPPPAKQPFTR
jgi:hypothetical protein